MIRTDIIGGAAYDSTLLEIVFDGHIRQAEYEAVVVPAVERALEEHDRISVLAILGEDFSGFDRGSAWSDLRLGLSHWRGFERIAIVTDIDWAAIAARVMAAAFPCPVRVFPLAAAEDARRWLREAQGTVHVEELEGNALRVRLFGQIDAGAIARGGEVLDAHIRRHGRFRVLLDVTRFDGWYGLSALGAHLGLVREHAALAERVAIVGNRSWQKLLKRLFERFLNAEARFFAEEEAGEAETWLKG